MTSVYDEIGKQSAIYLTAVGTYLGLSTVAFIIATLLAERIRGKLAQTKQEKMDALFFATRFLSDLFGALGGCIFIYASLYYKIANCSFWGYLFGIAFIRVLFIIGEKWERHFKMLHFAAMVMAFLVFSVIVLISKL